jgi:predicted AAA+ superfamily ATPase
MNLPPGQSAFLWGARKTGKSSYLKKSYPNSIYYDLLNTEEHLRLAKAPHLLREELLALLKKGPLNSPVIIDEIQKVPLLLDEVHWLIENAGISFILCGSSARKLKRGAANLLGGRAWRYHFFPLTSVELPGQDINLLRIFNNGLLPSHYLMEGSAKKSLNSYIEDYLKEEIQAEGLVRSLPSFAHFLDVAGLCNTEIINFTNIARDCGVNAKTVQTYFEILEDTLLAYLIPPYAKKIKRDLITSKPKFYFFDVGVANRLAKWECEALMGPAAGRSFEHFILLELMAYKKIMDHDFNIQYWRTHEGHEVDFILGDAKIAIEVKLTDQIDKRDLKGLNAFLEEHPTAKAYIVCQAPRPRILSLNTDIEVLPYQDFLKMLWANQLNF